MDKKLLNTMKAPAAIGPYSQGWAVGGLVFTSGQLPLDPETGKMPEGIAAQTKIAMENVKAVLEAGGSGLDKAVKTTVLLSDMANFSAMNEVYASYFKSGYPARTCFQAARLPREALVEIEAIGVI